MHSKTRAIIARRKMRSAPSIPMSRTGMSFIALPFVVYCCLGQERGLPVETIEGKTGPAQSL